MFASLLVVTLGLCYCSKESNQSSLGLPQLSGPSEALVGDVVVINCFLLTYPFNETILLQLFKANARDRFLGEYTSMDGNAAFFNLVIKLSHEGDLECVAKAQNNSNIEPTLSSKHHLRVVEPVDGATIEVISGPTEFFEGRTLELCCKLTAGNHVSYMWLLNDRLISRSQHDRLLIHRTTSEDSGHYRCVTTNMLNKTMVYTSNSSEVEITVKDVVSTPNISFTVSKEGSHSYSAVVTCQSTKGTPPVTFSLYNITELIAKKTVNETTATFKVPLVPDQHLGRLQCQAYNGDEIANSTWIPLKFVPVGGPVVMQYERYLGQNYAVIIVILYCKAAKGSLPRYQWFLNNTLLDDLGSFYRVYNNPPEHSILTLSVDGRSAGTYHCKVSDSFDNTTAISSKKRYLDRKVLNRLPVLVVAVIFGCFSFLVLLVSVCCGIGVVFRRRLYGDKSLSDFLEMERMGVAYDSEPDLSEYNEDADVFESARGDEFDQASEASVDEWPQIEEEKKTLEDEAVEEP